MARAMARFGEVPGSILENLLKTYHESVLYLLNSNIVGGEACSTPVQPRTTKTGRPCPGRTVTSVRLGGGSLVGIV